VRFPAFWASKDAMRLLTIDMTMCGSSGYEQELPAEISKYTGSSLPCDGEESAPILEQRQIKEQATKETTMERSPF